MKFPVVSFIIAAVLWSEAATTLPIEKVSVRSAGPGGGGWMECVLPSRHSRSRIFLGSDVGGFFISEDGGRNFQVRNCGIENYFVEAIAEHPVDENLLLLGGDSGVYRSTNRGTTWKQIRSGLPKAKWDGHSLYVTAFAFDGTNPDHVWMASGRPRSSHGVTNRLGRVWESFDAGLNWRLTVATNDALLKAESAISSFAPSMKNPKDLLLVNSSGVWKSVDGGVHWNLRNDGLPLAEGYVARCLARSPTDPDVVYLSLRQLKGEPLPRKGGIWKSLDGGEHWTACKGKPNFGLESAGVWDHHYWSEAVIAVDPKNPNVIWAGGSCWYDDGIWKSVDGGDSFALSFNGPRQGWIDFWTIYTSSLDVSKTWSDEVAFGTSGMLYRSQDGGKAWRQCYTQDLPKGTFSGNGLEVLCTRMVYIDPQRRGRIFLGFWDTALIVSEDGGKTFCRGTQGIPAKYVNSCFAMVQSPTESDRFFGSFGSWSAGESETRKTCIFAESKNGGKSWIPYKAAPGWPGATATSLALLNDREPYRIVAGVGEGGRSMRGIFISEDSGRSWHKVVSPSLPFADDVSALAVDRGVIYAGFYVTAEHSGRFARSADGGKTWETVISAEDNVGSVFDIAFSGDKVAFAAHDWGRGKFGGRGGCWLSADRGKSFKMVRRGGLTRSVAFAGKTLLTSSSPNPYRDHGFGSDEGLLASDDDGKTWRLFAGDGFLKPDIRRIRVNPFDVNEIWVGTSGNSAFQLRRLTR